MPEFNVTVSHTTSGKDTVLAVEPGFTVSSILEVLTESLQLKDRFILATKENKILDPALTIEEAGIKENDVLLLMPDPTGGHLRATYGFPTRVAPPFPNYRKITSC